MKIQLTDGATLVAEVEVNIDTIKEAAVIVYKGDYYIYQSMTGRWYQGIQFAKVNPPVVID